MPDAEITIVASLRAVAACPTERWKISAVIEMGLGEHDRIEALHIETGRLSVSQTKFLRALIEPGIDQHGAVAMLDEQGLPVTVPMAPRNCSVLFGIAQLFVMSWLRSSAIRSCRYSNAVRPGASTTSSAGCRNNGRDSRDRLAASPVGFITRCVVEG